MLRVSSSNVLVVPPFECAWLTGPEFQLHDGSGCLSFEVKGNNDVTVIFKRTAGAKRWQPLQIQSARNGAGALVVEQNYTVIMGSHRNSRLKIEKNGITQLLVGNVVGAKVNCRDFTPYWIDFCNGTISVGVGAPGENLACSWKDPDHIGSIQHVGLSCWDTHVSYRNIQLLPSVTLTSAGQHSSSSAVLPLTQLAIDQLASSLTPTSACITLAAAEYLLPATSSLYKDALQYLAQNFSGVLKDDPAHFALLPCSALADLLAHPSLAVSEKVLFDLVVSWAGWEDADGSCSSGGSSSSRGGRVGSGGGSSSSGGGGGGSKEGSSSNGCGSGGNDDSSNRSNGSCNGANGGRCDGVSRGCCSEAGRGCSSSSRSSKDVCGCSTESHGGRPGEDGGSRSGRRAAQDEQLRQLLPLIRFPQMTLQELQEVAANPFAEHHPIVQDLLQEAFATHLEPADTCTAHERTLFAVESRRLVALRGSGRTSSAVRMQRRLPPSCRELMFVHDGDRNGVVQHIATAYGTQQWMNPVLAKRLVVRASSPFARHTDPKVLVSGQFCRTSFAGPRYEGGRPATWWLLDLGPQHRLACNYYTVRQDGSQEFMRSFKLQASHDLKTWTDLRVHVNDPAVGLPGCYASWPVAGPAAATPYRAFRVLLTAPTTTGSWNLCICFLELYGYFFRDAAQADAVQPDGASPAS